MNGEKKRVQPLNCTEQEFINAFRLDGFLSPYMEEAVPYYIGLNCSWFDHAAALNRVGHRAYLRRGELVVGWTSLDPRAISFRLIYRGLSAFAGAVILYRRGMIAEGDTLSRNLYETAFWLGFFFRDAEAATRAFITDEHRSQRDQASFYLDQIGAGRITVDDAMFAELKDRFDELKGSIVKADSLSIKDVARRGELYPYYEAYKQLSASSAHSSLHSLHRFLSRQEDGGLDGHVVGTDHANTGEALSVLCIALGIALAHFCAIIPIGEAEDDLQSLLIQTDEIRGSIGGVRAC